jgi:1-acyl-sn-glycerol-3-phosphate acyltransferase
MQKLLIEEPYEFVPPHRGKLFFSLFKLILRRYLRAKHGIAADECRGIERLRESLAAGHGIILAPNHSRLSDPMAIGLLSIEADTFLHSMASWHVFKQDWLTTFVTRRLGAFSIYREGLDRAALNTAIQILEEASRPLVIFPEGCISRTNDQLGTLRDGTSFIARAAARKRARQTPGGKVVIHPVALKYEFQGDVDASLCPVLTEIEQRLSWQPQDHLSLVARIAKVGRALVCIKELEYFGAPQSGSIYQRLDRLTEHLLLPKEEEWLGARQEGDTIARVKALHWAIMPGLVNNEVTPEERTRRWRQLSDLYLAQQLSCYRRGYVRPDSPPERFVETVEGFEEDLTDSARVHGPFRLTIEVGEAIHVSPNRDRSTAGDPLMGELEDRLQAMLNGLSDELNAARAA